MAWTDRYVTADAAGGGDGTAPLPWTLAEAIAAYAAGDRVNVKAGTYANTTTNRAWAAAGAATTPVEWVGYNTTPLDIDSNNALTKPVITFTTGQMSVTGAMHHLRNIDVQGATVAANGLCLVSGGGSFRHCRFKNTAANLAGRAMTIATTLAEFDNCYFEATATADRVVSDGTNGSLFTGCSARGGVISYLSSGNGGFDSCVADAPTTTGFSLGGSPRYVRGCSVYGATNGILHNSTTNSLQVVNCLFSTCTNGVNQSAGTNSSLVNVVGCGFHAVTNPIVGVQAYANDPATYNTARGNLILTVTPFVSAATHDFSLTPTSLARGAGIPGAFENEIYVAQTDVGAVVHPTNWVRNRALIGRL